MYKTKEEIKKQIAKGEIKEAFESFFLIAEKIDEDIFDKIDLLKSRYNLNQKDKYYGTITPDNYNVELNRIIKAILTLLNKIPSYKVIDGKLSLPLNEKLNYFIYKNFLASNPKQKYFLSFLSKLTWFYIITIILLFYLIRSYSSGDTDSLMIFSGLGLFIILFSTLSSLFQGNTRKTLLFLGILSNSLSFFYIGFPFIYDTMKSNPRKKDILYVIPFVLFGYIFVQFFNFLSRKIDRIFYVFPPVLNLMILLMIFLSKGIYSSPTFKISGQFGKDFHRHINNFYDTYKKALTLHADNLYLVILFISAIYLLFFLTDSISKKL